MKKLNNKGFTLVELLAVLVILVAIMGIAIPTISSSLERTKAKQNEARYKILESAAEQYVTDNKNVIYSNLETSEKCIIQVSQLAEYLSGDDMEDADGKDLSADYIIFEKPNYYEHIKSNEIMIGLDGKYQINEGDFSLSTDSFDKCIE